MVPALVLLVLPILGPIPGLGAGLAHAQPPGDEEGTPGDATEETATTPPTVDETAAPVDEPSTETTATVTTPTAPLTPGEPPPGPPPEDEDDRPPRTYPRLVLAGGPVVGPHAFGNEECDAEEARCETKGSFLGLGGQLELRGRLWRLLYLHARGVIVGNVSPNDRVHRGVGMVGVGLGLYGRRAFGRGEYLYVGPFGDNHFEPPFYEGEVAVDEWGHHAGLLSVGFRQPLPARLAVELWGGLMIGPRSVRRVPQIEPDERVLSTFLIGLNLSWDAWP
ncbi:hypothetical protein [Paraliomyxa miuraensis]|uniref:hypothetical protein n=1 Tax=Paraliomyxa miuraensis TaxID=376150 RepID=UPI0022589AC5|nr:hypothetical protein [Paraliomyxa miuraensis]MCX4242984.1 hypothetical protein [Paraliomyxa miuraensis]